VEASERAHAAYARNAGAAAATADRLAFCDGDDVVAPTWCRAMAAGLEDHEFVTGPVELDRLNPAWLAAVRGRRLFDEPALLYDAVPFAHGCNFGVRRALLDRIGGFSDEVPLASEDIEFAVRAWRARVQLAWCPDAIVHYRHRAEAGRRWRQAVTYGRTQRAIRGLVPELVNPRAEIEHLLRRLGWLLLRAPGTYRVDARAQWLWTLGLVVGDVDAYLPRIRARR
jgi:GT2 family glycosyltransferase